ncbi:TRAP transporter small permease subunit [Amorphus orientalis]|uniref:TRAP transporter small permease protein n=1 Tax=Amorphus orientalis TaxID=649198 RepID=A0AAE4AQT4_9HYPH|nr:TRAP transporter small permease subunit [Amorphus orientalis]MDQ0314441.1 TRAP-type mannitol/chloroaromatic compound transport system permease small subunit [Amorphus orientalis]
MAANPEKATVSAERRRSPIEIAWAWLVEGLAAVGTVMICILMGIICADIVARNAMGSSLPLISELGALLLVMIVALQFAATVRADRLARTEIFFVTFRDRYPRGGAFLSALFNLVGALMIGGIAWATVHILQKDLDSGEFIGVPGIATLPVWPFRVFILIGMTITALEFARQMVADLWRLVSGRAAA